jgi:hypothetical protein
MSHERSDEKITFFCDNPACNSRAIFPTTDFVASKMALAREHGWCSTKQTGQPWRDWCLMCVDVAKEEQRRYEERERERERLKARNARE